MLIIFVVIAYLLGSIPTGKIVGRIMGIDLQTKGSGNIGFANAVRVLGWRLGVIVLVGDVSKGFLAVALAGNLSIAQLSLVAVAVIAGNVYPVWLNFRGGKGVATGLGALLAIDWQLACAGVVVYLLTFLVFRKSAYCSLASATSLPFIAYAINPDLLPLSALLFVFAFYTHRTNLRPHYAKLRVNKHAE